MGAQGNRRRTKDTNVMMSTEELLLYAKNLWDSSEWDPDGTQLNDLYSAIIKAGAVEVIQDAMDNYVEPHWDHWN
jgi:hypothetical protein